jgi:hypothetical protein
VTGPPAELSGARRRLVRAQVELLTALVAAGPVPAGFDPVRVAVQADALQAKRRDVVARLHPDLVEAAGAEFRSRFDAYARTHPRPAAGARADAAAFARTLPVAVTTGFDGRRRRSSRWRNRHR